MAYNHEDVVLALAARYPELLTGINDDNRREFARRLAQTLKARFPEEGWAHKSASPGRPPSKDAIVDKDMRYYDVLAGAATATPKPGWHVGDLIPDQHRIEVEAKDWLVEAPPSDPPVEDPPDVPDASDALIEAVIELGKHVELLTAALQELLDRKPIAYTARLDSKFMLGPVTLDLTPKQ